MSEATSDSESRSDPPERPLRSLRSRLLVAIAVLVVGVVLILRTFAAVEWSGGASGEGSIALLVAAAASIGASLWLADRYVHRVVTRPLESITSGAARVADGEHRYRIEMDAPAELARLAREVNRMSESLIRQQELLAENVRSLEETNRALVEARDDMVHAEKLASVGRLAAGLAHEIGNPLNSILAYAEVGRRRHPEAEWVEGVRVEAERIDRIISGLMDFARPKQGTLDAVDLNAVVRDTAGLLESQGRFKEIELLLSLDEELPRVDGDRARLQQVFVNLLLNACDALEEEGTVRPRVVVETGLATFERPGTTRLEARREEDPETVDYTHLRRLQQPAQVFRPPPFEEGDRVVRAAVVDNGPGIEADPPRRVFEPFFTTKEPGRGTGLGLAVCARLVQEMGGYIDVELEEEGGSVFTLYLARHEEDRA